MVALINLSNHLSYTFEMGSPASRAPDEFDPAALRELNTDIDQVLTHKEEIMTETEAALDILQIIS